MDLQGVESACPLEQLLKATLRSFEEVKGELQQIRRQLGEVEARIAEMGLLLRPEGQVQGKKRILVGPEAEVEGSEE